MTVLSSDEVVILDFETTGLSANDDRIIEVGAAIVKGLKIIKTFSSLCDPGYRIPYFITDITGITNQMIKGKPIPEDVMYDLNEFIGKRPILAHNASFDSKFLYAEMNRINIAINNPVLCTLLLSRRLIQNASNHKLGTLKKYINFKEKEGHQDHRALDDVKVTVALWLHLRKCVENLSGCKKIDINLYKKISKMPKKQVNDQLAKLLIDSNNKLVVS